MAEHLLELRNVSQVYRSGDREFLALKDVSLTLDEGEFLVLLGPSGMREKYAFAHRHWAPAAHLRRGTCIEESP
jgi:ABC-type iron transport system FetAB ATPase subunit